MQPNISPSNIIFILAYAFDLKWQYLEKEIDEDGLKDSSFFELMVFVLLKWVEQLVKHGLYRTFINIEEETKRLKGRVLFEPNISSGKLFRESLCCQFDDLSFDVLENQILLSTLMFCERELGAYKQPLTKKKKRCLEELHISVSNLARRLSSEVSFKPLSTRLFDQLLFHRMNISYRPIIQVCRFIYDAVVLYQNGEDKFFDIPENKMSEIFERFLRNYLAEHLAKEGFRVDERMVPKWIKKDGDEKVLHIPSIHPDIVIWKEGTPQYVIDAKFYSEPVYRIETWYSNKEEETVAYKTHSRNLYQLIVYIDYFNCDGLLVYAQTEVGFFEEVVKINPEYYSNGNLCHHSFGFRTLDLTGEFNQFKDRLSQFVCQIKSNVIAE